MDESWDGTTGEKSSDPISICDHMRSRIHLCPALPCPLSISRCPACLSRGIEMEVIHRVIHMSMSRLCCFIDEKGVKDNR
jgi:hypothetical protein